jgi:hypothetical protein
MAAAPVKAPESLAESQMRQLDNQVPLWVRLGPADVFLDPSALACRRW